MKNSGQLSFQTLVYGFLAIILFGGLIFTFGPLISAIWDLNINITNYEFARVIVDLWPVWLLIFIVLGIALASSRPAGV